MSQLNFIEKVSNIQSTLKAPKSQYNSFGKYSYRNAEDILEALKPLLAQHKLVLTINDKLVSSDNGNNFIEATATITDGTSSISTSALAREAEEQKGMNPAQITGSTSSYARKYALNGLFLIDDTKDADATNTHGKEEATKPASKPLPAVMLKDDDKLSPQPVAHKQSKPKGFAVPKTEDADWN